MRFLDLRKFALLVIILIGQACTVAPILPDQSVLPDLNEKSIANVEQAREAQRRILDLKADLAFQDRNDEIACYERFFVNACLGAIDMRRKAKQAQLRVIDGIAQTVIRLDRATEKNDALASNTEDRQTRAPQEAIDRQDALEKTQTKTETQDRKLAEAVERSKQDNKLAAETEAARLAKISEIEKKNLQARNAKLQEPVNRARYEAKRVAQAARLAKAAEKQKNAKTRAPILPREPRPVKR
jgi:colicin import membrane protein